MSSLKKRNISFYDGPRSKAGEGDLVEDVPSTDYIKNVFNVTFSNSDLILDPGCGVCSHLLSTNCGGKVGMDISLGNLKLAKNRDRELYLLRGDVENLPFKNNIFDAVFVKALLHHIPHQELALNNICRVVREGGHILINDVTISGIKPIYPLAKLIEYFGSKLGSPESFGPEMNDLTSFLKKNNFIIREMNGTDTFIKFLYQSFMGITRRLPLIGKKIWTLMHNHTTFIELLDDTLFYTFNSRFNVSFYIVAVKDSRKMSILK